MTIENASAPVDQMAVRTLLANMRHNNALNDGEHRALLGALRADLIEATWAAREMGYRDGVESHGAHECCGLS